MTIDKDSIKLGIAIANFRSFLIRFYDDSDNVSLKVFDKVFDKFFEEYLFIDEEDADCDKD